MEGVTQKIADFTAKTKFADLPKSFIDTAKRIVLDAIGCALAGYVVDRGKIAIEFAKDCGGNPQASVIGGHRTSSDLAAFVNGELICALDFENCGPLTGHVVPYVMPSCLAIAERVHASGKDFLASVALAHEIGGRVTSSLAQLKLLTDKPPYYEESPRFSYTSTIFGGVAGACNLLGLDSWKTANALGIAGASSPVPGGVKFQYISTPLIMVKFNAWSGWVARLATVAALLAEKGFTGDTTILDGEKGFWKMAGSPFFKMENLLGGLGEVWHDDLIEFKAMPCCFLNHAGVEAIVKIMREHQVRPEDIQGIVVKGDPILQVPLRMHTEVKNFADTQFTDIYVYANAVFNGSNPSPAWQMPGTFNRPEIKEMMKKVKIETHPRATEIITEKVQSGHLGTFFDSIVEITTRKGKFAEEVSWPKGTKGNRMTDAELVAKFRNNASFSHLSVNRFEQIIETVNGLEKLDDINKLTRLLSIP